MEFNAGFFFIYWDALKSVKYVAASPVNQTRAQAKGARLLVLRGINGFLTIHQTRSKSGALLLTMLDFTIPRGDERLTKGGAESAVQTCLGLWLRQRGRSL